MTNPNPATPAQAAAPGNAAAGSAAPSSTTPAVVTPTGQGNNPEGTVAISLKEYRDLQRAKARTLSFDKRLALKKPATSQPTNDDGADPELVNELAQEREGRQNAERRALQAEVRGRVSELFSKPEFKDLAPSTKSLILKNPAMLSNADNIEEAMLDIEDFVQEQVTLDLNLKGGASQPGKPNQPSGHETPPNTNGGNSNPAGNPSLEDTSKLSGPARSQATIRNALKKAKGVK